MAAQTPKPKRRRERGDDGISWDKVNKCYVGHHLARLRRRRQAPTAYRARQDQAPKSRTSSTSCTRRSRPASRRRPPTPSGSASRTGSTRSNSIRTPWPRIAARPRSGSIRRSAATKLKDFKATDADRFFRDVAKVLSKASLVKIKSTLVRSIRRAQKYDLIGRNVAELVDLPQGQPGHPSRAMTEEQASKVLKAAGGQADGLRQGREGQPGQVRGDPRGHRVRRAGVRHLDAPGSSRHRDRDRSRHDHLPVLPRGTRTRRRRGRKPEARSAVRAVDHARPAPRRTAQARLGSRRPRQRSDPRVAVGEPDRRRQDAEVEALARTPQARRRRAPGPQEAPGGRTAGRGRRLAGQQPRLLPRGRAHVHQRRAQLAVQQDDQASRHRPLARPRGHVTPRCRS